MKQNFFNRDWWQNAIGATFGTLVGIILTFGTTFYMESKDKADMARKTVKITLHNLDVRIRFMQREVETLKKQDSLFRHVTAYYPDSLQQLDEGTLRKFIETFIDRQFYLTDKKSENIFSHSFDVWKYLDDEKIIGRISCCYSMLDFHNEQYAMLREECRKAFMRWLTDPGIDQGKNISEQAKSLMDRPDVVHVVKMYPTVIQMLEMFTDIAQRTHEYNKQAVGIPQKELDEVGNLLETNSYEYNIN